MEDNNSKIMNTREAALYLRITEGTLRKLCREHDVPFARVGARKLIFRKESLDIWIKRQEKINFR